MIRFCLQIIFFPAYFSKLRFHRNSIGPGYLNHFFCQCHIFFKCFMGSIDHHRSISGFHRLYSQLKAVAVIQMKTDRNIGLRSLCFYNCCKCFQRSILDRRWSSLQHNRRAHLFCRRDHSFCHLHIFYIECSHCIPAFLCV